MKDKKKIKNLIEALEFDELYEILSKKNDEEVRSILFSIAYDDDCFLVYTFINNVIQRKETPFWHYLASSIMATAFCQLKYGYQIAYYHAKKALELSPNSIELKNYILLFYSIPERFLSKDQALDYAREVYDQDNGNNAARQVLGLPLIS